MRSILYQKEATNLDFMMDELENYIKILADVFEALVGAIFIDSNLDFNATR